MAQLAYAQTMPFPVLTLNSRSLTISNNPSKVTGFLCPTSLKGASSREEPFWAVQQKGREGFSVSVCEDGFLQGCVL